jgi:3-isopropylmalate dehydratase, large subunit (EC 4.2.1.33)
MGRTLYDKIWDEHVVHTEEDGTAILYIDRHLVHEVDQPPGLRGPARGGPQGLAHELHRGTADHNTPTTGWENGYDGITDRSAKNRSPR